MIRRHSTTSRSPSRRGGEDAARTFYGSLLGMTELAKPAALAARGGCWFTAGTAVLHLGVETAVHPGRAKPIRPSWSRDLDALFDAADRWPATTACGPTARCPGSAGSTSSTRSATGSSSSRPSPRGVHTRAS